jgi:hypothetical protein
LKFYKSSLNSNINITTYKDFFRCLGISLCSIQWFFFEFLTPSTLGAHNFLNSILFFMIFNALEAPIEGVKFCLNTKNNGAIFLDLACLKRLNVIITT